MNIIEAIKRLTSSNYAMCKDRAGRDPVLIRGNDSEQILITDYTSIKGMDIEKIIDEMADDYQPTISEIISESWIIMELPVKDRNNLKNLTLQEALEKLDHGNAMICCGMPDRHAFIRISQNVLNCDSEHDPNMPVCKTDLIYLSELGTYGTYACDDSFFFYDYQKTRNNAVPSAFTADMIASKGWQIITPDYFELI